MEMLKENSEKRYTYADYITWDDGIRREIYDGVIFEMSAPTVTHQRVSGMLHYLLMGFLMGKSCEVFASPFDVRLSENQFDDTIVQPDILVVCDPAKLADGKSCKGAPDMVIEILSDSTSKQDRLFKYNLYRHFGVREYWIVDPIDRIVQVYLLLDDKYVGNVYNETDKIAVTVLEGCEIDLNTVFTQ